MNVLRDVPIGPMTTYRVGGAAARLVRLESERDIAELAREAQASGDEIVVVGKGSNLLVTDAGFAGLAVVLGEVFERIDIDGTTVTAGGAAFLPVVIGAAIVPKTGNSGSHAGHFYYPGRRGTTTGPEPGSPMHPVGSRSAALLPDPAQGPLAPGPVSRQCQHAGVRRRLAEDHRETHQFVTQEGMDLQDIARRTENLKTPDREDGEVGSG